MTTLQKAQRAIEIGPRPVANTLCYRYKNKYVDVMLAHAVPLPNTLFGRYVKTLADVVAVYFEETS